MFYYWYYNLIEISGFEQYNFGKAPTEKINYTIDIFLQTEYPALDTVYHDEL